MPAAEKKEETKPKDTKDSKDGKEIKKEEPKPVAPPVDAATAASELIASLHLCDRAAATGEQRFIARLLRKIPTFRRLLQKDPKPLNFCFSVLNEEQKKIVSAIVDEIIERNKKVAAQNSDAMDVDTNSAEAKQESGASAEKTAAQTEEVKITVNSSAESRLWIQLLTVILAIDTKKYEQAVTLATILVDNLAKERGEGRRKTVDPIGAQALFYFARSHELSNSSIAIRKQMLEAYRTACLRHDKDGQATILNLLLRNYLSANLYDQADKLISKTTLSETDTPGAQYARYLYYKGRIRAVQLDYSEASRCLLQASRKAPNSAVGFKKSVAQLAVIVRLLMGEIPERNTFRQDGMVNALKPYFELTQAVRIGDVERFQKVVETHGNCFIRDGNATLIQRLRRNVIKIGLRKINISYSRIHLSDVCTKLHIDNEADAEFIVAKAIRDGVIDAFIDHEGKFIHSKETSDVYSTTDPQDAFHKRILFCLNLHNDSVKSMRFPPNAHETKETEEELKERLKLEAELAKEIEEDADEDY